MPVIARYASVTLIPAGLIALGASVWAPAGALALLWLTVLAAGMDRILAPPQRQDHDNSPWSDALSVILGLTHPALMVLVLLALNQPDLSTLGALVLILALASFTGQVSHPNAHELIHRRPPALRAIGAMVYASVGFGHHVSAHRLVHHRHVGTADDPNTPRAGESFWAYLPRAWAGSFQAGLAAERARLTRQGGRAHILSTAFALWMGGALVSLALAFWLAGVDGALVLILWAGLFGAQVLMSDYIQHYGLERLRLANGRREAVSPHHSWNAPSGFTSYLMMNAPAHSEHHMHPDRPYDRLDPLGDVPMLPHPLPVMAALATIPPIWRRVMDRRAQKVMAAAQARLSRLPQMDG